jgi:hypothetical protein
MTNDHSKRKMHDNSQMEGPKQRILVVIPPYADSETKSHFVTFSMTTHIDTHLQYDCPILKIRQMCGLKQSG